MEYKITSKSSNEVYSFDPEEYYDFTSKSEVVADMFSYFKYTTHESDLNIPSEFWTDWERLTQVDDPDLPTITLTATLKVTDEITCDPFYYSKYDTEGEVRQAIMQDNFVHADNITILGADILIPDTFWEMWKQYKNK